MEAMYPDGKTAPPAWFTGTPMEKAENKSNELHLPDGYRP
jgi:hypothetical protein